MDNPITDLKQRIRQHCSTAKSTAALAKAAGLNRNALYGVDREDWNPKASTLEALWPHLQGATA